MELKTSMKKTAIPAVNYASKDYAVLTALKTSVETLTGQTGTPINKLGDQATLQDVLVKINQIIDRLQP
jgi:hypothetical protein